MQPNPSVRYRVRGLNPAHAFAPADVTLDDACQAIELYKALKSAGYADVTATRIITTVERIFID